MDAYTNCGETWHVKMYRSKKNAFVPTCPFAIKRNKYPHILLSVDLCFIPLTVSLHQLNTEAMTSG